MKFHTVYLLNSTIYSVILDSSLVLFYFHSAFNYDHFYIEMKIRAVILLVCFCGLFNGTETFADYVGSLFSSKACNKNTVEIRLKKTDQQSTNNSTNEESCCCNNSASSVYIVQNGFSYTPSARPSFKPISFVVNHYSTTYLSSVWRPPAVA